HRPVGDRALHHLQPVRLRQGAVVAQRPDATGIGVGEKALDEVAAHLAGGAGDENEAVVAGHRFFLPAAAPTVPAFASAAQGAGNHFSAPAGADAGVTAAR